MRFGIVLLNFGVTRRWQDSDLLTESAELRSVMFGMKLAGDKLFASSTVAVFIFLSEVFFFNRFLNIGNREYFFIFFSTVLQ